MDALIAPRPRRPQPAASAAAGHDLSVHGILGIRLIGATPADVRVISLQLGARSSRWIGSPDIVIRFVDRLPEANLCHVGSDTLCVSTRRSVIVRRGARRAEVDFDTIGGSCEIRCESGIAAIPLLEPIADVAALGRGYAALHASAFLHRDRPLIAAGWANGGKTTALLAFAEAGATFVSDDRVWIREDGERMVGFAGDVTLKGWQLESAPSLAVDGRTSRRLALRALGGIDRLVAGAGRRSCSPVSRGAHKALAGVRRRLEPCARADRWFPMASSAPIPRPHAVFVMMRHDAPGIVIDPISGSELATRVWTSARQDHQGLLEAYRAFRFAFPTRPNRRIESSGRDQWALLNSALRGSRGYVVRHPAPVSLSELYRAMEPCA